MVCFAWIFFRANNVEQALYIVKNSFDFLSNYTSITEIGLADFIRKNILIGKGEYQFLTINILMIIYSLVVMRKGYILQSKPLYIRWFLYYVLIFIILIFNVSGREYIYFQF